MYSIDSMTSLNLGEHGEHLANEIRVDMSPWVDEDNTLRFYIVALRHAETNPYIPATTMEDNVLVWPVTSADTAITGAGLATFVATDGTRIKKSKRIKTTVGEVIPGTDSDTPPDPASGWVERVINTVQALTEDAQAAKADAESAAEHAESVTEGIDQAGAAQIEAVQAAGAEVINSIPADYSALTDEVTDLKSAIQEFNAWDLLDGQLTRTSGSTNGFTFAWSGDICTVTGSATGYGVNILRTSVTFPSFIVPGRKYYVKYKTTDKHVALRIIWRTSANDDIRTDYIIKDEEVVVPTNAAKWTIALFIDNTVTLSSAVTVSEIAMLNAWSNEELTEGAFRNRGVLESGTDLDTIKAEGHYILGSGRSYSNLPPVVNPLASFALLEVFRNSDDILFQRFTFGTTQRVFKRATATGAFTQAWVEGYYKYYSFETKGVLPSGTDINDVKEEGHYLITNGYEYTNAPYETPSSIPGTLEVLHTTNNTILQRVTRSENGSQKVYIRQSTLGVFPENWTYYQNLEKYSFSDLDEGTYIVARVAMYVSQTSLSGYSSKLIPVKKGDVVHLRTASQYPILPFAVVKYNYLVTYKEPFIDQSITHSYEEDIVVDNDGFIAINCIATYKYFLLTIEHEQTNEYINKNLYTNALQNPYNFIPEYDENNLTKVLKKGPSLMGAIHHWGLIGASYDSGEFNYTKPGATEEQRSSLDYYEYSWMSELQRANGIKDLYHYSNGGQNAKQWITLIGNVSVDGTGRGYCYTTGEFEVSQTWNGGLSETAGIGPGGGCWWKLKEDFAAGKAKQAYVVVLGSNDINNNNPHDSSWNELAEGSYDTTLYYKAGSIEDIGTYDLATDTDTPPSGKTAGVVPGIVNSYAAYIGAILNRIIAQQPDCIIFLSTIRNNFAWNESSLAIWNGYNNVLKQISQMDRFKSNVLLIDFAEYGPNYMQKDLHDCLVGMHPNAIGYHEVAYYYGTLIDYAIRNNFKRLAQSAFIGTNFIYRYDS